MLVSPLEFSVRNIHNASQLPYYLLLVDKIAYLNGGMPF